MDTNELAWVREIINKPIMDIEVFFGPQVLGEPKKIELITLKFQHGISIDFLASKTEDEQETPYLAAILTPQATRLPQNR